ncbi:MAG: ABC transporter permease [Granulosicoccus sp.]
MSDNSAPYVQQLSLDSVIGALKTQSRVINALLLREAMTRYGQHKIGFLWALIEPIIMVLLFLAVLVLMRSGSPGGMPHVQFMIAGIVPFMMFRNLISQMQGALSGSRSMLGFPQVTTFDVIIARGVLEVAVMMSVYVLMLSVAHLLGYSIRVERPLEVLAVCGLFSMTGIGLGFFFASVSPIIPSVRQISSVFMGRPLLLGSGLFYVADVLPTAIRDMLLYNPILHLMELLRSAFFIEFESTYASWGYAVSWAVGSLALGLTTHQALKRRAIVGL